MDSTMHLRYQLCNTYRATVWEEYTARSIYNCKVTHSPIVLVSYRLFCLDPHGATTKLYDDLESVGVNMKYIKKLSRGAVIHRLGARWLEVHKEKFGLVDDYLSLISQESVLSRRALQLWNMLHEGVGVSSTCLNCMDAKVLRPSAWLDQPLTNTQAEEAYAYFVDDTTIDTMRKMKVVAASILQFDSSRDLVAIVKSSSIGDLTAKILRQQGWLIKGTSI